jgi:hypothetical protein
MLIWCSIVYKIPPAPVLHCPYVLHREPLQKLRTNLAEAELSKAHLCHTDLLLSIKYACVQAYTTKPICDVRVCRAFVASIGLYEVEQGESMD